MKLLAAALVLLLVVLASAEERVSFQGFPKDKTLTYDVWINTTSEIPGMSPQVAKSAMHMEVDIRGVTHSKVIISIRNYSASGSLASVGSKIDPVEMKPNKDLEHLLNNPFEAVFKGKELESYTLGNYETLESKNLKESILRSFMLKIDEAVSSSGLESKSWPMTYNITTPSPVGNYSSRYILTSSPYPNFPKYQNVINVTKTDDLEAVGGYMAHKQFSNFDKQGCPGVCKKDHVERENSASCPPGWETHNNLMKESSVQNHNFIIVNGKAIHDMISATETHKAYIYDQNMQVTIQSLLRLKRVSNTPISEPTGQTAHRKLKEWRGEPSEEEINKHCKYTSADEAIVIVKDLLDEITDLVLKGNIDGDGKQIPGKLVLLQEASTLLTHEGLDKIQEHIVSHEDIAEASVKDKIKRQFWLHVLPLIGTQHSFNHLMHLIKESAPEKHNGAISLFEAKTILEALPQNIHEPDGKTIEKLSEICDIVERSVPGFGMYYSACRMAVARVIRILCSDDNGMSIKEEKIRPNYLQQLLRETDDYKTSRCPRPIVKKYIQERSAKLKETTDNTIRIIDMDAMAQTGMPHAIPILEPCVLGNIPGLTPSYRDYLRTVCIYALHNLAEQHPERVKKILLPVFTNRTEPPKVRTAAFSVIIKCQPTLSELQLVAEQTWHEPSEEVCSFVTTTLETFGNSSIPCDQSIAQRIKVVFPQIKRCDYGKLKSQNRKNTVFDDMRRFGLEHNFEVTHSNESFFPSSLYFASKYFAGNVKENIYNFAMNSQGMNSQNLWDAFHKALGLKPAANIPKKKESEIFPEVEMADRANEWWRFTLYQRLFYSMSYYYIDDKAFQNGDIIDLIRDHLRNYVTNENGQVRVHMVHLLMPATYESRAIAKIIPSLVSFSTKNPVLLYLKAKIVHTERGISIDAHPIIYHSMHYSHKILNLGDCKHVGVFHEKNVAMSYHVRVEIGVENDKIKMAYSFPEFKTHPKQMILHSESQTGTFTMEHKLDSSIIEKKTIQTIPTLFVRNVTVGLPGLPSFEIHHYNEDISSGYTTSPRYSKEAIQQFFEKYLNSGWRCEKIVAYHVADNHAWKPESEIKISMAHSRDFVKPKEHKVKPDDSWVRAIKFDDHHDEKDFSEEQNVIDKEVSRLTHVHDRLVFTVDHKVNDKTSNTARFIVDHNRTLERDLHSWRVTWNATTSEMKFGAVVKGVTLYANRINIFNGEDSHEDQKAVMISTMYFQDSDTPYIAFKAVFDHKSLEHHLSNEFQKPIDSNHFKPETHEQCQQDIAEGKSQSVDCTKAIRERAQFNHGIIKILHQELPRGLKDMCWRAELAFIHAFFDKVTIGENKSEKNLLVLEFNYINKFTDKPSYNVKVSGKKVLNFRNIMIPILPISSTDSWEDVHIQHHTNNTYPATCTLSEKYVTTFDMEDIALPKDRACSYILTSHCVRHKTFAVLVNHDPKKNDTIINIHVGKDHIVLSPGTKSKYEIEYNGKSYSVEYQEPLMLNDEEDIYGVVVKNGDGSIYIEIHAVKAGVITSYDGKHARVQVHSRYKGELCGLCSEFNGERVKEMRGPSGCLYSHVEDFTRSCALGSCHSHHAKHKSICSNDDYDVKDIGDKDEIPDDKEYEPNLKRNIVSKKGNEVCFSVKCHPHCGPNYESRQVKTEEVGFHCLPKNDENTRKLLIERGRRCLGELEMKPVDEVKEVSIDSKCVERH